MKKLILIATFLLLAHQASAATWDVLGGSFYMEGVSSAVTEIGPGDPGLLVEGSCQGLPGTYDYPILSRFSWFGGPFGNYTSATGIDGVTHAAPSIDFVSMTADMSSWYGFWGGTEYPQGGLATVTDNGNDTYTLAWSHLIDYASPFDGYTGDWTLDIAAVPEPASMLLIGSGLAGLVGFGKRKKS